MNKVNTLARLAGLSYLLLITSGIFGMVYVPSVMFNWPEPLQTLVNFDENITLFRVGIAACLMSFIAFTTMSVMLYRLFAETAKLLALFLLCFGVMGASAFLANTLNYVEILTLISNGLVTNELVTKEVLAHQVLALSATFSHGFTLIQVLTGLWLILFGYISFKCQLMPRIISVLLILSGTLNYIVGFILTFVLGIDDLSFYISLPGTIGEFSACLWLLILGTSWQQKKAK